jgi:hypothetical protein
MIEKLSKRVYTAFRKNSSDWYGGPPVIQVMAEMDAVEEILSYAEKWSPCFNCTHRKPSNYEGYALACQGESDFKKPRTVCEYQDPIIEIASESSKKS